MLHLCYCEQRHESRLILNHGVSPRVLSTDIGLQDMYVFNMTLTHIKRAKQWTSSALVLVQQGNTLGEARE